MAQFFLDSSALVKRYVNEIGSSWIQEITRLAANHTLFTANITKVEVFSAFARLKREVRIDQNDLQSVIRLFQTDWNNQYHIVEMDGQIIEEACQLVQKYPIRAYDSVQLASAIVLFSYFQQASSTNFTFVTADTRLQEIARMTGLDVINPNNAV